MNLPTEIDQDVKCPECGSLLAVGTEDTRDCLNPRCEMFTRILSRKCVAALRNRRTPGTVEIPNAELEALRDFLPIWWCGTMSHAPGCRKCDPEALRKIDAILAHLPAKVDHVAVLREMLRDNPGMGDRQHAALEAAIKAMEKP